MRRVRFAGTAIVAGMALFAGATTAYAQTSVPAGSWEVTAGGVWVFGRTLGSSSATLDRPSGDPFELFKTETSMDGGVGAAATLGWAATDRLVIEAGFSWARPGISTRVTSDADDAPAATASTRLHQYVIEGSVRWYLRRTMGRFQPYVRAGAGYLRQLDADHAHVETGTLTHVGAGVDRVFRDRPDAKLERVGLRLEGRLTGRSGGFDIEDAFRISGAAGASLFFGF